MGGGLDLVLAVLIVVLVAGGGGNGIIAQAHQLCSCSNFSWSSPELEVTINFNIKSVSVGVVSTDSLASSSMQTESVPSTDSSASSSIETESVPVGVVDADESEIEIDSVSDRVVSDSSLSSSIETDHRVAKCFKPLNEMNIADCFKAFLDWRHKMNKSLLQTREDNGKEELSLFGHLVCMATAVIILVGDIIELKMRGLLWIYEPGVEAARKANVMS